MRKCISVAIAIQIKKNISYTVCSNKFYHNGKYNRNGKHFSAIN